MDADTYHILTQRTDPAIFQSGLTKDEFIAAMDGAARRNEAYFFRFGGTVFFVQYANRFIGAVHLFSVDSGFDMLRAAYAMIADARSKTLYRLEVRTANKGVMMLARRAGFVLEGLRRKSYFTPDGFIDEYELGLLLWDI